MGIEFDLWRPLAGLMLFLLSMTLIERAIKVLVGNKIKTVIASNTQSPVRGLMTGTIATALLQSSSLVGLLVLAFVGARVIALKQALLIIFGANLGTTATGWLVALLGFKLDLDVISLPLIAIGGLFHTVATGRLKQFGELGMGLGLLLLALGFMKSAFGDMDAAIEPGQLAGFALWQYALFGVAASALMQSSSAVMVLTLSAINSGVIDLPSGAALMIGADLGTTTTVLFGAIGGSANKKRVATGHVVFNVVTDLIAFVLIVPLLAIAAMLVDPLLSLVAFHTLFNIVGLVLWTPLVGHMANWLQGLFNVESTYINKYLDPSAANVPESAVAAIEQEVSHLAQLVLRQNIGVFTAEHPSREAFRPAYFQSKKLEAEILEFALTLAGDRSETGMTPQVDRLLQAGRNLLLSSKLCKDNADDLGDLAGYHPELFVLVTQTQRHFYASLPLQSNEIQNLELGQLDELLEQNQTGHDALHDEIYTQIKNEDFPRAKVSTVLNLNRALYNSNLSCVTGIALLLQHHQAQILEAYG